LLFFLVDGKISSGGDFLKRTQKQAVTGICGTVKWCEKKVRVWLFGAEGDGLELRPLRSELFEMWVRMRGRG